MIKCSLDDPSTYVLDQALIAPAQLPIDCGVVSWPEPLSVRLEQLRRWALARGAVFIGRELAIVVQHVVARVDKPRRVCIGLLLCRRRRSLMLWPPPAVADAGPSTAAAKHDGTGGGRSRGSRPVVQVQKAGLSRVR